jgi:hypothetical protein
MNTDFGRKKAPVLRSSTAEGGQKAQDIKKLEQKLTEETKKYFLNPSGSWLPWLSSV